MGFVVRSVLFANDRIHACVSTHRERERERERVFLVIIRIREVRTVAPMTVGGTSQLQVKLMGFMTLIYEQLNFSPIPSLFVAY
jgi:hypothetical protein